MKPVVGFDEGEDFDFDAELGEPESVRRQNLEQALVKAGVKPHLVENVLEKLAGIGVESLAQLYCVESEGQIEDLELVLGAELAILAVMKDSKKPFHCKGLGPVIRFPAGEPFELKLPAVVGGQLPYEFLWLKNYELALPSDTSSYKKEAGVAEYDDSGWYCVRGMDAQGTVFVNEFYVQVVRPSHINASELEPWQRIACWLGEHKLPFEIDHEKLSVTFTSLDTCAAMPHTFPSGCVYWWQTPKNGVLVSVDGQSMVSFIVAKQAIRYGLYDDLETESMETILASQNVSYIPGDRTNIIKKMKELDGSAIPDDATTDKSQQASPYAQGHFFQNNYMGRSIQPTVVQPTATGVVPAPTSRFIGDASTVPLSQFPSGGIKDTRLTMAGRERLDLTIDNRLVPQNPRMIRSNAALKALSLDMCRSGLTNMGMAVAITGIINSWRLFHQKERGLTLQRAMSEVAIAGGLSAATGVGVSACVYSLTALAASSTGLIQTLALTTLKHLSPIANFAFLGTSAVYAIVHYSRGNKELFDVGIELSAAAAGAAFAMIGAQVGAAVGGVAGPIGVFVGVAAGCVISYIAGAYLKDRNIRAGQRAWACHILGLPETSSPAAIAAKFRQLAQITAPDKLGDDGVFADITKARNVLLYGQYDDQMPHITMA
eukprot:TRINITY_DN1512_c0_g1_i1.p1 TRINITY_DN1512_c0_g1~~TRINITY_DN1512_c0_g1_i1.p1  ORF type:complete len:659 (-),score=38.17 TRINITY_DN1512_c0_g1_i1:28-2004(-)